MIGEHGTLAIVPHQDIIAMLARVISGELSIKDNYDWSNLIIGRDTIGYETGYIGVIDDVLSCVIPDFEVGHFRDHPDRETAVRYANKSAHLISVKRVTMMTSDLLSIS